MPSFHRSPNTIPSPLPDDYARQQNFSDYEANNPGQNFLGSDLDAEFNAVGYAVATTQDRLALIQADDGSLKAGVVGAANLTTDALLAMQNAWNPRGPWATGTVYAKGDIVSINGQAYVSTAAQTSSTDFNNDLTAGLWIPLGASAAVVTAAQTHASSASTASTAAASAASTANSASSSASTYAAAAANSAYQAQLASSAAADSRTAAASSAVDAQTAVSALSTFYAPLTSTGTAAAYTVPAGLSSYTPGQIYQFSPHVSNTGACTVDFGPGRLNITLLDGSNPAPDDLVANGVAVLRYDGAEMLLVNPEPPDFFSGGNFKIGPPGVWTLPNGAIWQWGQFVVPNPNSNTTQVTVTFPTPFPTAVDCLVATPNQKPNSGWGAISLEVLNVTATSFDIYLDSNASTGNWGPGTNLTQDIPVFWDAKGH